MKQEKDLRISVGETTSVSARLEIPDGAKALLVFAHGAGAGMLHPAMTALAEALHEEKIGTLRFQFPYMERGSKRPDPPAIAIAAIAAAVRVARAEAPKLPLLAGGKSFGGRMTTTAAASEKISDVRGLVCFGFPLHPAKQPATTRAKHLADVTIPTLLVNGTRDDLADLKLLRGVVKKLPLVQLHVVEAADHSFGVLKSSGRTPAEVLSEVAEVSRQFCDFVKGR